jgi:hypothetical protein
MGTIGVMGSKRFRLSAAEIIPLATGRGGCIASDRIVVDGRPVGYMYREQPRHDLDSGWRFLAGDEDEDYMDDPSHHAVYDVNTIANYDRDIIALLDSGIGSRFAREEGGPLTEPGIR